MRRRGDEKTRILGDEKKRKRENEGRGDEKIRKPGGRETRRREKFGKKETRRQGSDKTSGKGGKNTKEQGHGRQCFKQRGSEERES